MTIQMMDVMRYDGTRYGYVLWALLQLSSFDFSRYRALRGVFK